MIDLVDGLSLGSVVLVSVTNGNLTYHDARLKGGPVERLPGHGDQAQAITATLLVVVRVLLGGGGVGSNQTLSCRTTLRNSLFCINIVMDHFFLRR